MDAPADHHAPDPAPGVVDRPSPPSLRLVAAIIDFTVVMVAVVVVVAIGNAADVETVGNWVGLSLLAAYPIVAVALYDQTLGKRLCNLVVRDTDGGRPGWVRSIVRFVVSAIPLVAATLLTRALGDDRSAATDLLQVVIGGITYAPIAFDRQRRGLHDMVAGTRVVCTAPPLSSLAAELAARAQRQADEAGS